MGYIDTLIQNCNAAKLAVPCREFVLKNLAELDNISHAVYIIEQLEGDITAAYQDFSQYKKKKERKCAKLNFPSNTMYVGSSTTGVKQQLQQHVGDGYHGTHALHLKHWFKGNYQITIKVYDEPKDVIQIIQDDISDMLKPAFGEQGDNKP